MADNKIVISEANKARLAQVGKKALSMSLGAPSAAQPRSSFPASPVGSTKISQSLLAWKKMKSLQKKVPDPAAAQRPAMAPPGPSVPNQPLRTAVQQPSPSSTQNYIESFETPAPPVTPPPEPVQPLVHVHHTSAQDAAVPDIELTREECFCCVMDILLEGMSRTDKASKQAAKNLMIVMENEVGTSVSLLVFNSYVRKYNALREQYFISAAASLKSKTIKISTELLEQLEQMTKTIKIEIPQLNFMPPRPT